MFVLYSVVCDVFFSLLAGQVIVEYQTNKKQTERGRPRNQ